MYASSLTLGRANAGPFAPTGDEWQMRLDCAETETAFLRKRIAQLEERLQREQQSKAEVEQKAGRGEGKRGCKRACGNAGGPQDSVTSQGPPHHCLAAAFGLLASLPGPGWGLVPSQSLLDHQKR